MIEDKCGFIFQGEPMCWDSVRYEVTGGNFGPIYFACDAAEHLGQVISRFMRRERTWSVTVRERKGD